MKKTLSLIFISAGLLHVGMAQEFAALQVRGNAQIAVSPTLTTVHFNIESKSETYTGAIEQMTDRVNVLVTELKKIDFKEEQILTSTFSVQKSRIYVKNIWKDSGFVAVQQLQVSFPQDKKRLLQVVNTAADSKAKAEISLSFGLDDQRKKEVEEELIRQAVKDAARKAEILTSASGTRLTGIREISYGVSSSSPGPLYTMAESSSYKRMGVQISSMEISNLTFSDEVTIVYSIGPVK